jgi:predicted DNA-binding transcriptional regulator YafY
MAATREQAQKGAAKTNAKHALRVSARRVQVQGLLILRPAMSAEAVALDLGVSHSTIRSDWRALRTASLPVPVAAAPVGAATERGEALDALEGP